MVYYLFDKTQKSFRPTITRSGKIVSQSKPLNYLRIKNKLFDNRPKNIINTPLIDLFWQNASPKTREFALLSYFLYVHCNCLINIEISNWTQKEFFKNYWEGLKNEINFRNILNPKRFAKNIIQLQGNHRKSIRFDNIHLTEDLINGEIKHFVHWDIVAPHQGPLHLIGHWLQDVFRKNRVLVPQV